MYGPVPTGWAAKLALSDVAVGPTIIPARSASTEHDRRVRGAEVEHDGVGARRVDRRDVGQVGLVRLRLVAVEAGLDRGGVHRRPVLERHAVLQLERQGGRVGVLPRLGQVRQRLQRGRIERDQRVVHRVQHLVVAAGRAGLRIERRGVGRNPDAQRAALLRRWPGGRRRCGRGRARLRGGRRAPLRGGRRPAGRGRCRSACGGRRRGRCGRGGRRCRRGGRGRGAGLLLVARTGRGDECRRSEERRRRVRRRECWTFIGWIPLVVLEPMPRAWRGADWSTARSACTPTISPAAICSA